MKKARMRSLVLCFALLIISVLQLSYSQAQTVTLPAPLDLEYNVLPASSVQSSSDRLIGASPYAWQAHNYSARLGLAVAVKTRVGTYPIGASFCEITKVGDYSFLGAGHCIYPDEETGEGPLPTTEKLELGVYGGPDDLLQGMVMPRIDTRVECEVHPDYNFTPYFEFPHSNDALLCKAEKLTPHIAIAPIGGKFKGMLTVVGHGNTIEYQKLLGGATKQFSTTLLGLELPYLLNDEFRRDIYPWTFYQPTMFGAGYPDAVNVRDTHSGDSGAGLVNEDGRLVGIVSHGIDAHKVGIYTRLPESSSYTGVGVDLTRFEHYRLIHGYENVPVQQPELPRSSNELAVEEDCECYNPKFPQWSKRNLNGDGNSLYDFIMTDEGNLVPVEPYERIEQPEPSEDVAAITFETSDRGSELVCGELRPEAVYYGKVTRVVDGDTVDPFIPITHLDIYMTQRQRLFGINAPERKTVTREAGDLSKLELENLTDGKTIRFEIFKDDSFGRGLTCMYEGDEELSINDQMIQNGHAIIDLR